MAVKCDCVAKLDDALEKRGLRLVASLTANIETGETYYDVSYGTEKLNKKDRKVQTVVVEGRYCPFCGIDKRVEVITDVAARDGGGPLPYLTPETVERLVAYAIQRDKTVNDVVSALLENTSAPSPKEEPAGMGELPPCERCSDPCAPQFCPLGGKWRETDAAAEGEAPCEG